MTFRQRLPWVAASLALGLACTSCGRSPAGPAELPSAHGAGSSTRVRSVTGEARPTLRLVHREGDPRGAMAVAVFTTEGSRGALLLGHLVRHRLATGRKWAPELHVHGIGFVLSAEVGGPADGAAFLDALYAALMTSVEPGEVAQAGLVARSRAAFLPTLGPSLVGGCGAEFGAEGGAALGGQRPPTAAEVEAIRRASVRAGRVGLSALGAPALLDRVAEAHHRSWPKGGGPIETWPTAAQVAVRSSAGVLEVRVAARVVDQARALSAGRALEAKDHPVFLRLRALDSAFEPGPVTVALRPAGACVTLRFVHAGPSSPAPGALAAAALVLEQELGHTLRDAPLAEPSARAVLAPERALEAASLAAWTTVSVPTEPLPPTSLVEVVAPASLGLETNAFSRLLESTQAGFDKRQLPLVSRLESGQAESWLLLASQCGTSSESSQDGGLRKLALESVARAFSGKDGVSIEPWVEARAVGLLAHGAPRAGESPEQLAERLARAAVVALTLGSLDGTTVAGARAEQLLELGSDPGRDFLLRALSGDRPSLLDPRGLEREVAALSTLDVERARHALSREPLRAAYIASAHSAEAPAARAELSRLLAPHRADVLPCPKPTLTPAAAGAWSLSSVDRLVSPGALVGVPLKASSPSGYALEYLLNRDQGYLDRALVDAGLADAARAEFLPGTAGGSLLVHVHAPEPDLDRALAQARGVLASLTSGVPTADAHLARSEEARRRAEARRGPRGRLIELWLGRLPPPPVDADLDALSAQLGAAQHRVVKVQVRAEASTE